MKTLVEQQTLALAFYEICQGVDPWIALGNFMNDFFGNFPEAREALLREPPQKLENSTDHLQRWAAFCAASAEHLAQKYALPCPAWAVDPAYMLAEPWFLSPTAYKPHVRERLMREAPEAFSRRNIYCSKRVFANKYERPERSMPETAVLV